MKNQIKFYKIKDVTTNLYSCGGVLPKFNKHGKTWNNIGHIKSHIRGVKQHQETISKYAHARHPSTPKPEFRNWQIEEYTFEKKECKIITISEVIISSGLF
jgi:hypothetical protein